MRSFGRRLVYLTGLDLHVVASLSGARCRLRLSPRCHRFPASVPGRRVNAWTGFISTDRI